MKEASRKDRRDRRGFQRRFRGDDVPASTAPIERLPLPGNPLIIPREEHSISRKNIDEDCLKVMRRLIQHGYRAFMVGGAVRDLQLGRIPKDFDLSTDADPERVRQIFRNSRIIGKRFKLNQVYFRGNKIIEVSTFRDSRFAEDANGETQTLARDNTYGDPETDAVRRDLSINGLFYDLETFSIVDYVGGIQDLRDGVIRIIGVPTVRITEDPVRMIRVVRHAARTNFTIDPETYAAICDHNDMLAVCPRARVYEEFQRELAGGYALRSFRLLDQMGLLKHLLPHLAESLAESPRERWQELEQTLGRFDSAGKPVSRPAPVALPPEPDDGGEDTGEPLEEEIETPVAISGGLLSIGLGLSAILIGNLPESITAQLFKNRSGRAILAHWLHEPAALEESEHASMAADDEAQLEDMSGVSKRRQKNSPLMRFIDELMDPIGVPRKERERIEELLVLRLHMLTHLPTSSVGRSVLRSAAVDDALLLLEISEHSDAEQQALSAYRQAIRGDVIDGSSEQPRRRRRRRRRSRGGPNQPQ